MTINQKLTNEQLSSIGIKKTNNEKDTRNKELNINNSDSKSKKK